MRLMIVVTILSLKISFSFSQSGTTYRIYTAKEGELLVDVAKRFNVFVQDILKANPGMVADQFLRQGEVILVPVREQFASPKLVHHQFKEHQQKQFNQSQSSTSSENLSFARAYWVYTVQEGDSLESIAKKFGATATAIAKANNLTIQSPLTPNQVLVIPVFEHRVENETGKPTKVSTKVTTSKSPNVPSRAKSISTKYFPILPAPRIFGYVGTVVAERASIRSSPNKSAPVWSRVFRGTQLIVTTQRKEWYGVLMINGATGWIQQKEVQKGDRAIFWDDIMQAFGSQKSKDNNAIVAEAMRYLGAPYKYGGVSPITGLDCSALVQRVFANRGISLPRTAAQQAEVGIPVPLSDLQPGDRLYFAVRGKRIDHCGIYIGNGMFIHASGRHNAVVISSLSEPIYARSLLAIRR
ncbi:MAG: NlpC/P60 family protein [Armatimonadetes bacterium]|nr:NlpC/P60 family protein [Armatimonadota bacterium]